MSPRCAFLLAALASLALAAEDATELKIEVVSVPEGCTVKSKTGDTLTMHYTGTLANGEKFDSR